MFNSFKNLFYSQSKIDKLCLRDNTTTIDKKYLEELYKSDSNLFNQNNTLLGYINKQGYISHISEEGYWEDTHYYNNKNVFDLSKITKNNFKNAYSYADAMRNLINYNNRKCFCGKELLNMSYKYDEYNKDELLLIYTTFNYNMEYDILYNDKTKYIHSKTNCSEI